MVSRFTPPICLAFSVCAPLATGCVFGVATKAPVSASAITDAAAVAASAWRPRFRARITAVASTAKAATSMIAATMPAVVRTSVKPNRPTFRDSR